jgi:hypothetical protein
MDMAKSRKPRRTKPGTGKEFFALEETCWRELASAWRGMDVKALAKPGACGPWSIKDVFNHLAAWQEVTVKILPILLRNGKLPAGEFGLKTFNAKHYWEDRSRSITTSRDRLNKSRKKLLAALGRVPEKRLLDVKKPVGNWAKYSTYEHYDEHLFNIRDFRARVERAKSSAE